MTYVKAKSNSAFSPVRDPIDRRPLHIGIVLLVGGQSKRMGCNKQLLPWRGKTVLDAVCGALQGGWGGQVASTMSCKLPFVAVTGDDHEKLDYHEKTAIMMARDRILEIFNEGLEDPTSTMNNLL